MKKLDAETPGFGQRRAQRARCSRRFRAACRTRQARVGVHRQLRLHPGLRDVCRARDFYQERARLGIPDLVVHDAARKSSSNAALYDEERRQAVRDHHVLLSPGLHARRVAVGVLEAAWKTRHSVYDATSGARIAGPLERVAWSNDVERDLADAVLQPPETRLHPPIGRLQELHARCVGSRRRAGHAGWRDGRARPKIGEDEFPVVLVAPGAPLAVLDSVNGVQNETEILGSRRPPMRRSLMRSGKRSSTPADTTASHSASTCAATKSSCSHKATRRRSRCSSSRCALLDLAQTSSWPSPTVVIEGVHAAADALYVQARARARTAAAADSGRHHDDRGGRAAGSTWCRYLARSTDPRGAGVTIDLSSWTTQPALSHYDPQTKKFTEVARHARRLDAGVQGQRPAGQGEGRRHGSAHAARASATRKVRRRH